MNVDSDSVTVGVEFSHPTYLRILHHLDDDRDVGEWLKTLAWVQIQRDVGRFEELIEQNVSATGGRKAYLYSLFFSLRLSHSAHACTSSHSRCTGCS